jgi:glycosyltransferase involved in cell wall biosynthesis
MREIFVNGRFLCRKPTGVDRYAIEVLRGIDQLLDEQDSAVKGQIWTVLTPSAVELPADIKHIKSQKIGPLQGSAWEQLTLPTFTRGHLLINLCNAAPIIKKKQVVVIHDATTVQIPQAFSKNFVRWYNFMIPLLLKRSQAIATVSSFSKTEIVKSYGIARKITVVKEGADHFENIDADDKVLEKNGLTDNQYILAVGSMAPHKNFKTIVEAVEKINSPNFECVIVGGTDPRVFSKKNTDLPKWVKHVGYVTDGELKSLYRHAKCFVFPSIYEGYGLPPTEALALGCPVISSNTASMPEVCGSHVTYFSPTDSTELAHLIKQHMARSSSDTHSKFAYVAPKWRDAAIDIARLT